MKTFLLTALTAGAVAVVISASFSGCGSNNTSSNSQFLPLCTGAGCITSSSSSGGDTEAFTFASNFAASQYAGTQITNPTGATLNINLTPVGTAPQVFLGQMSIQFTDGFVQHKGTFVNGSSLDGYLNFKNDVSVLTTSSTGKPTYRIFFEDMAGVLVLTLSTATGADTAIPSSGQVWFYNFNTQAPNPLYAGSFDAQGNFYPPGFVFCWMITLGPYDCRNFNVPPSNSYVDSAGGNKTIPGFSLLGSVSNVNLHLALGI